MYNFSWAIGMAFVMTVISGPILIPFLKKLKFGQYIRQDGPAAHFRKAGTPTMGGIMFLIGIVVALFFAVESKLSATSVTLLVVTLGHGIIGFADDFIKIVRGRSLGLRARDKILAQLLLGIFLAFMATNYIGLGTFVKIPLIHVTWEMGFWYYPFVLLVLIGTTNAVNLTDGLDGLAAGSMLFASLGYALIALMTEAPEIALFGLAVAGGCAGFLVYNKHPARIFMGDTGSLALGAALASMAVFSKTELILPLVGGIFVIETLSVIIQVISFRLTGRRVFRMSPLHHHFELAGWSERRVVRVFWLVSFVFSLVGIAALYNFA
ncbi:phospho-N-acetylmuramoyl-pentapeptide-transferase [Metallumcola ferriviriculae]|uniref:Phospho-N-acetylmuramoyl-pentapeptide-transferase n=1 Tax=Metallumcola ferriviriculae TaxID=3039180 RepID=A0AAU0UP66_9FIRM|nr:phospho-N-acetylmuramoyl-pentapeptide-transferase [Desulfitibacteraceae bacterium MK1]